MTLAAAQVTSDRPGVPVGNRALARLSGLLPLVAAACVIRLILLAGTSLTAPGSLPEPADYDVAAASAAASTAIFAMAEPTSDPFPHDLGGTDDAAVAPAAGPAGAAATTAAATQSGVPAATAAGTSPDSVLSPKVLLEVAAELKARRELVERRERELETREAALALVEERLAAQIDRLESFKQDLEGVLGRISADEEARLAQLAKVYEAKKAASILDSMGLDLLLAVVRRMRDAKVAAVIAEMDPAKARLLTAELAKAKMLPTLTGPAPSAPPTP